ncbi:MAG: hypothetical protein ACLQBD_13365 [Syntrophobacteraceae bacterium]
MKKTIIILLVLMFGAAAFLYAQSGSLIVLGWLGVGGVTSPNYSTDGLDVVGDVNITGKYKINGAGAGVFQNISAQGGIKSGSIYQNTSATAPAFVSVWASTSGTISVNIGLTSPPEYEFIYEFISGSVRPCVTFIVPPNYFWSVTAEGTLSYLLIQ